MATPSAVCMTCGVRDGALSTPDGKCQNNHDNWLEPEDVEAANQFMKTMAHRTCYSWKEFTALFNDPAVTQFKMIRKTEPYQRKFHSKKETA